MIRITIIADRVEELRAFLRKSAEEGGAAFHTPVVYGPCGPIKYEDVKDLAFPEGSYKPKHAKTGAVDGQLR